MLLTNRKLVDPPFLGMTCSEGNQKQDLQQVVTYRLSFSSKQDTKGGGKVSFTINAAGKVYKQTIEFVYLGGAITADRKLSIEITRRLQRAWVCSQRYKMEIYDRPSVRLRLKVRLLRAEVIETLLYGCMTRSPNKSDYDRLQRVHRSMLLRCL